MASKKLTDAWKREVAERAQDKAHDKLPRNIEQAIAERYSAKRTIKTGQSYEDAEYIESKRAWYLRRVFVVRDKGGIAIDKALAFIKKLKKEAPSSEWKAYAQTSGTSGRKPGKSKEWHRQNWVGSNISTLGIPTAFLMRLRDNEPEQYPGEETIVFDKKRIATIEVIAFRKVKANYEFNYLMSLADVE